MEHEEVSMLSQPEHRRTWWSCRSQRARVDANVVSATAYAELLLSPECTEHEEVLVEHEEGLLLTQPEHRRTRWSCRNQRARGDVVVVSARAYAELLLAPECTEHQEVLVEHEEVSTLSQQEQRRT